MGGGGHDSAGHGAAPAEPIIPLGSSQDFALTGLAWLALAGIILFTVSLMNIQVPQGGGHEGGGQEIHAPGGAVEHSDAGAEHGTAGDEHAAAAGGPKPVAGSQEHAQN